MINKLLNEFWFDLKILGDRDNQDHEHLKFRIKTFLLALRLSQLKTGNTDTLLYS